MGRLGGEGGAGLRLGIVGGGRALGMGWEMPMEEG